MQAKNRKLAGSYAVLIALFLFLCGCKHKTEDSLPSCIAGTGGNLTLVVFAYHNGISIPNYYTHPDTAFIRFGTTISPGINSAAYSTFFVSAPGDDHIHCPGLRCGDYFIYRTAWDSVAGTTRYGGYGISIADTSGDKIINIAVN
ncbi:MAG: hypothetical protein NTW10_09785 [Bacteroidetes bacterium]|nr:hypothetical protein [Bacteroidota bacterium]